VEVTKCNVIVKLKKKSILYHLYFNLNYVFVDVQENGIKIHKKVKHH